MKKFYILMVALAAALAIGVAVFSFTSSDTSTNEEVARTEIVAQQESEDAKEEGTAEEATEDRFETCTQTTQKFQPSGDDLTWSSIKLYVARSEDGKTFDEPELFMTGGGVPTAVRGANGDLVSLFQWFPEDNEEGYNKIAVKISTDDGETWSDPQMICLADFPLDWQAPYDPTITVTEDGQYRMFYTTHELGVQANFYYGSAISSDGIHYTFEEGVRFEADERVVDSSVVRVDDVWYMVAPIAMQNGKAFDAVSTDGLTFTQSSSNRSDDMYWVGNLTNDDGVVRFYGASQSQGKIAYSETTDGKDWSDPVLTNIAGGDTAIVITEEGEYLLIYIEPKR